MVTLNRLLKTLYKRQRRGYSESLKTITGKHSVKCSFYALLRGTRAGNIRIPAEAVIAFSESPAYSILGGQTKGQPHEHGII